MVVAIALLAVAVTRPAPTREDLERIQPGGYLRVIATLVITGAFIALWSLGSVILFGYASRSSRRRRPLDGRPHAPLRPPPLAEPHHLLRPRSRRSSTSCSDAPEDSPVNALMEGLNSLLDISILLYMLVGLLLGFMVGAFPGITATMAVALAAGFTMTLEPVQGLAVLLTIYVAANFGDRVPSILINTPPHRQPSPASIATTLDDIRPSRGGQDSP